MNDTIKALLKAIYPKAVIETVSKETIPEDFKPEDAISSMHTATREKNFELFKNDEGDDSFKVGIIKEQDGKWTGSINNHIKKYGVNYDDVKDLPLTEKLKFLVDHVTTETSTKFTVDKKGIAEEVDKLQKKNLDLTNEITTVKEERDTKVKEAQDGATNTIKAYQTNSNLKNQFSDIPAEQLLGKKHSDGLYGALKNVLDTKYDTILNEDKTVGFHVKGTTEKPEGDKEGQKVILSTKDVLMQELDELGFLTKSNGSGGGDPPAPIPIPKGGDPKPLLKNQSAAMDTNLALLKTAAEV